MIHVTFDIKFYYFKDMDKYGKQYHKLLSIKVYRQMIKENLLSLYLVLIFPLFRKNKLKNVLTSQTVGLSVLGKIGSGKMILESPILKLYRKSYFYVIVMYVVWRGRPWIQMFI